MSNKHQYWAVVPAAGIGKRVGGNIPKQYQLLAGKPVISHTLSRLTELLEIQKIVVCTAPDDLWWPTLTLPERVMQVDGGAERYHSVLNGLYALRGLADPEDWVLVHDAARPCVRTGDIKHLIESGSTHSVGAILAVPVRDTMKRTGSNNIVQATISREHLWHALTPQMFRLGQLTKVLENIVETGKTVTDEAQAMEVSGFNALLVEGHTDNLKITWPQDLALAAWYLENQIP